LAVPLLRILEKANLLFMIKYFIILFTASLFHFCIQESTKRATTESLKELREKSQKSLKSTINEINLKNSIYRYADTKFVKIARPLPNSLPFD
jgi:hypothetical protein